MVSILMFENPLTDHQIFSVPSRTNEFGSLPTKKKMQTEPFETETVWLVSDENETGVCIFVSDSGGTVRNLFCEAIHH